MAKPEFGARPGGSSGQANIVCRKNRPLPQWRPDGGALSDPWDSSFYGGRAAAICVVCRDHFGESSGGKMKRLAALALIVAVAPAAYAAGAPPSPDGMVRDIYVADAPGRSGPTKRPPTSGRSRRR